MEPETYTPVSPKFVFEKIKFKVLHYIQHDFTGQGPGLSNDQISMFKSLFINYLIVTHSNDYIKGDKNFFLIKAISNIL